MKVQALEVNGRAVVELEPPVFEVARHWHYAQVVITTPGGQKYTVLIHDLRAAIDNAVNAGRPTT